MTIREITEELKSVLTGKTIDYVIKSRNKVHEHDRINGSENVAVS